MALFNQPEFRQAITDLSSSYSFEINAIIDQLRSTLPKHGFNGWFYYAPNNNQDQPNIHSLLKSRFPYWDCTFFNGRIRFGLKGTAQGLQPANTRGFEPIASECQTLRAQVEALKNQLRPSADSKDGKRNWKRACKAIKECSTKLDCAENAYRLELEQLVVEQKKRLISYQQATALQTKYEILKTHQATKKRLTMYARKQWPKSNQSTKLKQSLNLSLQALDHITDWRLEHQAKKTSANQASFLSKGVNITDLDWLAILRLGITCLVTPLVMLWRGLLQARLHIEVIIPVISLIMTLTAFVFVMSNPAAACISVLGYLSYMGYLPFLFTLYDTINNLAHDRGLDKQTKLDLILTMLSLLLGQIPGITALISGQPYITLRWYSQSLEAGRKVFLILFGLLSSFALTFRPLIYKHLYRGETFYARAIFRKHISFVAYINASTVYWYNKLLEKHHNKADSPTPDQLSYYLPLLTQYCDKAQWRWSFWYNRHNGDTAKALIARITSSPNSDQVDTQAQQIHNVLSHTNEQSEASLRALEVIFKTNGVNPTGSLANRLKYVVLRNAHEIKKNDQRSPRLATRHGMFANPPHNQQTDTKALSAYS